MAKVDDSLHEKIAAGLGNTRVSPAILAMHMLKENLYVNESLLQYMVNYINIMANSKLVPIHLSPVVYECRNIQVSLAELGLLGIQGRTVENTEYLQV